MNRASRIPAFCCSSTRCGWLLTCFLATWGLWGCGVETKGPDPLAEAASTLARSNHSYNNAKWAATYERLQVEDPMNRPEHRFAAAMEYLRAGDSQRAVDSLARLKQELQARNKAYEQQLLRRTTKSLALAGLRLGEQQNCIHHHGKGACILPLIPEAQHQFPQGSRLAIEQLSELLAQQPEDYEARYLLNLAYATLGTDSLDIPPEHRLPHAFFHPQTQAAFEDRAPELGLATNGLAGGVIADDFNQDGLPDLVLSSWDMQTFLQLFVQQADGSWVDISQASGLGKVRGGLNLLQADYNNDGWLDVLVLRGGWLGRYGHLPNSLLRNNGPNAAGKITFTELTETAGLHHAFPTQTAAWADFNNDGWLDVMVGNESAVTGIRNPSQLYLNQQDGSFQEVAKAAGCLLLPLENEMPYIIKGVAAGDYNRDGWMDLYVSTRNTHNVLLQNLGVDQTGMPRFKDVTREAGLDGLHKTFSCWFWDVDNDGFEDILASGFHSPAFYEGYSIAHDMGKELLGLPHDAQTGLLFHNQGDGTFRDVSEAWGLGNILYMMGGNFGDIDNDGWLDFYVGNGDPDLRAVIPNRMFRFDGKRFQEMTTQGFGHIQKGHGAAFFDPDRDGDQDIYMVMGGFYQGDVFPNVLLENQLAHSHHYVQIQLVGRQSNRYGQGSLLKVVIQEEGHHRHIYRRVNSGGSFGASPLTQHIGLGRATQIDSLYIDWAGTGIRQLLTGLAADTLHLIQEPDSDLLTTSDQESL